MAAASILSRLGWLLLVLSLGMIPPTTFAFAEGQGQLAAAFFGSAAISAFVGVGLILAMRGVGVRLGTRSAVIFLLLSWLIVPVFAAFPLYASGLFANAADAYFEAVSGLTTTGATLLEDPSKAPGAILIWRSVLQWFGGLAGAVTAAVVVLGVVWSGIPLSTMPMPWLKDHSFFGRMDATFLVILPYYAAGTGIVALWAFFAGLPIVDALCIGLSSVSTGGFTTSEADLADYGRPIAAGAVMFGMIFGSLNIFLHCQGLRGQTRVYTRDRETAYFAWFTISAAILVLICLSLADRFAPASGVFMALSLTSTSGYLHNADAMQGVLPGALVLWLCLAGGAAVSTAGGIKIIRVVLLFKLSRRELTRLAYPHSIARVMLNGQQIEEQVLARVGAILMAYLVSIGIVSVLVAMMGADFDSAISAAVLSVSNTGPVLGLATGGEAAYTDFSTGARIILAGSMIFGRVEVLVLLTFINPAYWRG